MERDQQYWKPTLSHRISQYYTVSSTHPNRNYYCPLAILGSGSSLVAMHQSVENFHQEKCPGQTEFHLKIPQVKLEMNTPTFLQARQGYLGYHLTLLTLMSSCWCSVSQHLKHNLKTYLPLVLLQCSYHLMQMAIISMACHHSANLNESPSM